MEQFLNYIKHLKQTPVDAQETGQDFSCKVFTRPNGSRFTQVTTRAKNDFWTVRLSKKDLQNDSITKGFFNKHQPEIK